MQRRTNRPRKFVSKCAGEPLTGDHTDSRAHALHRHHQRPREEGHPEKRGAVSRACYRIGRDSRRIIVGCTCDYSRSELLPVLSDAVRSFRHALPLTPRPLAKVSVRQRFAHNTVVRCGLVSRSWSRNWDLSLSEPQTGNRFLDLLGDFLLHLLRIERLQHLPQLGIVAQRVTQSRVETGDEVKCLRHLFFDAEIDLQRQLLTQLADFRLTALAHEHEDRKEDRFERDDHRQQSIGKWIEARESEDRRIPQQPAREGEDVKDEEASGAGEIRQASQRRGSFSLLAGMLRLDGPENAMCALASTCAAAIDACWQRRSAGRRDHLALSCFGLVSFSVMGVG